MKNDITVTSLLKVVDALPSLPAVKDEVFFKSMMEHGLEMSDDAVIDWRFCEPRTWKEIKDKYMTRDFTGSDVESMMNKNNNYITTPAQLKPHELFQSITEVMLEVFKRKNADYGNSFDKSLDDDGLLVAKVRLGDKYNRFSQLIRQPQQVADESLEDTLLDMANYAIMTVMWMRGQDKQMTIEEHGRNDVEYHTEEVYTPYKIGEHVKVTGGVWFGEEGNVETIEHVNGQQPIYTLEGFGGVWFQHNDLISMSGYSPSKNR